MERMDRLLSETRRVTGPGRQKAGIHGVIFFKLFTEYPCKQEKCQRETVFPDTFLFFFIHIMDTQYVVFLCCILT